MARELVFKEPKGLEKSSQYVSFFINILNICLMIENKEQGSLMHIFLISRDYELDRFLCEFVVQRNAEGVEFALESETLTPIELLKVIELNIEYIESFEIPDYLLKLSKGISKEGVLDVLRHYHRYSSKEENAEISPNQVLERALME